MTVQLLPTASRTSAVALSISPKDAANPGLPQRPVVQGEVSCPSLLSKGLLDLQRFLSIPLDARYYSQRSESLRRGPFTPLLNGPFEQHTGLVDTTVEQEHLSESQGAYLPVGIPRRVGPQSQLPLDATVQHLARGLRITVNEELASSFVVQAYCPVFLEHCLEFVDSS